MVTRSRITTTRIDMVAWYCSGERVAVKTIIRTRICASLGLRMRFKTLFMSDDIGRLDCSLL